MIDQSYLKFTVAVLAGRRIDSDDSIKTRFPLTETENVANKLFQHFQDEKVKHLVCSAACGADIIAIEVANKLGIPTTIVLPFPRNIFKKISVSDRPGDWGDRFDRLIDVAQENNNLIELGFDPGDVKAFSKTNTWILNKALKSELPHKLAFVVWEGKPRGDDDFTAEFLNNAHSHGFKTKPILTIREKK